MKIILYEPESIGGRLGMLYIFNADNAVDKGLHLFTTDGFHDAAPRFGRNDAANGTGFFQISEGRFRFRIQMGIGRHVEIGIPDFIEPDEPGQFPFFCFSCNNRHGIVHCLADGTADDIPGNGSISFIMEKHFKTHDDALFGIYQSIIKIKYVCFIHSYSLLFFRFRTKPFFVELGVGTVCL